MDSWTKSAELYQQAAKHLAGGVSSYLRRSAQPVPLYAARGEGAHLIDMDGNDYVDYVMAYGPLILGHAHPAVVRAVSEQAGRGTTFGAQHAGELALAQRLTRHVPCADLVALTNSGTEAVQLALRTARAYTGRQKVVRFHGHYHGWSDSIFTAFPLEGAGSTGEGQLPGTAGQSRGALADLVAVPWNNLLALEDAMASHGDQVAAIIMEPVVCNSGCLAPRPGYLAAVQELSRRHGAVLIFDEVICGFRLGLGGAQERFGVTPDLVVLGKAIAGGLPLSAVGGRGDIMELLANGTVSHLGTLNGNPLCTAAAVAALDELAANNGAAYRHMERIAHLLVDGLRTLARRHGVPLLVNTVGPVFHTVFTDQAEVADYEAFQRRDAAACTRFVHALLRHGVLVRPSGLWYVSTAHTEADAERTLAAADRAFRLV